MQKIWVIEFFFKNGLHWKIEVKKKITTNRYNRLHFYFPTNKTLTHNSLYVFDKWGKKLNP